jgi:hypothetical protein
MLSEESPSPSEISLDYQSLPITGGELSRLTNQLIFCSFTFYFSSCHGEEDKAQLSFGQALTPDELLATTRSVHKRLDLRRPIDRKFIEECISIARQAPNGGNRQNWAFRNSDRYFKTRSDRENLPKRLGNLLQHAQSGA